MGNALPKLTFEAFLAWENEQEERHEFVNGEVFAMVGGRRVHGLVVGNAFASIKQQLKGTPCRVFATDMKVQVGQNILYPDVFVTCDRDDLRTDQIFRAPTLVIEVLSPATEGYNRGLKFALYRGLPSLREYVLVHPTTREVSAFRRDTDGLFKLHDFSGAARIELASIDRVLEADDLFEDVQVDDSDEAPPAADTA